MTEISIFQLLTAAMVKHGGDGLYNAEGPCGCSIDDLSPGDCMSSGCVIAKSKIATEDDVDDITEVGDTIYFPIDIKEDGACLFP